MELEAFPCLALVALLLGFACNSFAAIDESKLPPPASTAIDFNRDIKPILENHCLKCHGEERPKSKFRLTNREAALKGGTTGIDIISGDSAKSPLIHYVAGLVDDMQMPPPGKGEPLTSEQIGLLRAWIDQGVDWAGETGAELKSQITLSPTARWITVSGDEHKFRELHWMKEGWSGGIENSTFRKKLNDTTTISAEARALADQHDYKFSLRAEKNDVGFARFGFEEFRKYYDDTGGFYGPFPTPAFDLNRDLHLDVGKASADFGLTLPDWPVMVLGYEYQFRDGAKSTLQWGPVIGTTTLKNIFPASKAIDERVHIIKFDLTHEIGGVGIENNFRGEFYDLDTRRANAISFTPGGPATNNVFTTVNEGEKHFQGANTLRLEKRVKDWWFASGGYFYSHMDADASFKQDTLNGGGALTFGDQWFGRAIVLERESHVFNLNSLLGPWQGLTFSAGLQNEWSRQKGFGDVNLAVGNPADPLNYFPDPAMSRANLDTALVEENFALRYTAIPSTVLFAESRFKQVSIGQFEESTGGHGFLRDTDETEDLKEYRGGFTVSPWRAVSLTAQARHRDHRSDYDHFPDINLPSGTTNVGYSAFIRSRDVRTDEIEAKLVLRPANFLKTSLGYKLLATDYHTTTDPVINPFLGTFSPGGEIFAGNYDANIYSLNTTLTPVRRFYISTTFSFQQTRTATAHQGFSGMVNYRGDVWSVLSSANYALSDTTDLTASYSYSRADFGQINPTGLPTGIIYDWHGAQAGITRRFKKNITTTLQYGFYRYDEPSAGGRNDFIAHSIFATLSFKWP